MKPLNVTEQALSCAPNAESSFSPSRRINHENHHRLDCRDSLPCERHRTRLRHAGGASLPGVPGRDQSCGCKALTSCCLNSATALARAPIASRLLTFACLFESHLVVASNGPISSSGACSSTVEIQASARLPASERFWSSVMGSPFGFELRNSNGSPRGRPARMALEAA